MPQLKPLSPNEHCRIQVLSAPVDRDQFQARPDHVAVFIEAHDLSAVRREIERLGGHRGVIRAVFAEPAETPRDTFSSHGFLCADREFVCCCQETHPLPRNFLRWGLPSSRGESKR